MQGPLVYVWDRLCIKEVACIQKGVLVCTGRRLYMKGVLVYAGRCF
jgi:hypothetical protein